VNLRVKSSLPETVDRLGLYLRDDKLVKEWSVDYDDYTHSLSLRGGNESDRRGNPSCLGGRGRPVSSLAGSQWIATGLRARDDKLVKEWSVDYDDHTRSLSLRGENEVSDAAIHRVSGNAYDLSLRLLAHSGSPRANALAMTRLEWTGSEYNFVIARKERSERRGNPSYLEGDERLVSSLTG